MNKYQKLFKQIQKEKQEKPDGVNDRVLILDGLNTFIRAFGATPSVNEDGDHVGGITGFLYSIGKVIRDQKPTRCIIVFDGRGGSKRRKKIHKDYKANRANKTRLRRFDHHFASIEDEQEAMRHQFSRLVSYLDNLPVTFLAIDGIEADDTIAYICDYYKKSAKQMTIVSTDRDFYQLVDDTVRVWSPIKKKMYTPDVVKEEFGVSPINMVMYRSFIGDKSDNIEGIRGIGPKTLLKHIPDLISDKEVTLESLFEKSNKLLTESKTYKKILEHRDILERNHKLMDLTQLDIPGSSASNIRNIIKSEIPVLNKTEFQKLFMYDKLWATMKNMPEWLNKTWLSLNAYAQQTHK